MYIVSGRKNFQIFINQIVEYRRKTDTHIQIYIVKRKGDTDKNYVMNFK